MSFVDPDRFKRFEQFISKHLPYLVDAATRGFGEKGPGAVVYRPADDQFKPVASLRLEYKPRAEIEAAQAGVRDELIQGMLERYQPPNEALFVAIYPDHSYDVSRVIIQRRPDPSKPAN